MSISIRPLKAPLHERRGINNRLLLALPPATLDRILKVSEPVSLVRGQRIDRADQPIKHIHFINRGLVCIVKTLEDGRTVEIGAIGIEGVTNLLPLVGIDRADSRRRSCKFQERLFALGAMP